MNIEQLIAAADSLGIERSAYVINEVRHSEQYVLEKVSDEVWVTFYSERGNRNDLEEFATESDACEHLLSRLKKEVWSGRR